MDKNRTPNQPDKKTASQDPQQQKRTQGENEPKAGTKAGDQQQQRTQGQNEPKAATKADDQQQPPQKTKE